MLPKILANFEKDIEHLDGSFIDMDFIETADISTDNPLLFLYQSGYLTIKGVVGGQYILGFPNREVKKALFELVIPKIRSLALVFDKNNRGLIDWTEVASPCDDASHGISGEMSR